MGMAGEDSPVGKGDLDARVGEKLDVPARLVDDVVVVTAQQREVAQVGPPAVAPVVDVVGVAPCRLPVAPGVPAASVAND